MSLRETATRISKLGLENDYHGACDLVFLHAPDFRKGLDIHVRTKIRYLYSYIESVAIRIGSDIFEVSSWGDYVVNGAMDAQLPQLLAETYPIRHTHSDRKKHVFTIDLSDTEHLVVQTFKDMVSIKLKNLHGDEWKNSTGLVGHYGTGAMLARDGTTVLQDPNEFGQEWQVRETESMLFQSGRSPQYPKQCILPDVNAHESLRRRLEAEGISEEAAEKACAHYVMEGMRANCVFDVLATQDLELATAGAL